MYTCPVCGYDHLRRPPENFIICPSCGTEFGYSDSNVTNDLLRAEWLLRGAPWHSAVTPPPMGWNASRQLAKLNEAEIKLVSEATASTPTHVHWIGTLLRPDQARLSSLRVECFGNILDLVNNQAMRI